MVKYTQVSGRLEIISESKSKIWDLIIIGGGITGSGIALDAISRGLDVLLIEKGDFASGTSSKSTKLIHGGLRYLKQFEIGLVRESGRERAVLHHLAPHLVHPEKMLLPIVENGTFGKISASIAILFYDFLAKVPKEDQRQSLTAKQTLKMEPLLHSSMIKGGIQYSEYRTDDARLTIEILKTAVRKGAFALNYVQMEEGLYNEEERITGIKCKCTLSDDEFDLKARNIVSAAGPWVDSIRAKDGKIGKKLLHLTKGVHVVVNRDRLPISRSIYFDAFDGRMIFAIPRGKVTYLGTSDTNYSGDLDRVVCEASDLDYLIKAANRMFDLENQLVKGDVVSSWAGLRPLIHEEGKSPSELSRRDEIFEAESGLISIAGGKLTGYRKMAERVVDLVVKRDGRLERRSSGTKDIPITKYHFESYSEVEDYVSRIRERIAPFGLNQYEASYLVTNYGMECEVILERMQKGTIKPYDPQRALLEAELWYTVNFEMVVRPDDFFIRRTGRLFFDIQSVVSNSSWLLSLMSKMLNWDTETFAIMKEVCERMVQDVTSFKN